MQISPKFLGKSPQACATVAFGRQPTHNDIKKTKTQRAPQNNIVEASGFDQSVTELSSDKVGVQSFMIGRTREKVHLGATNSSWMEGQRLHD